MSSSGRRLEIVLALLVAALAFGGLLSLLISSFRGEGGLGPWGRLFVSAFLVGMTTWGIVRIVQWATRGSTLHRFESRQQPSALRLGVLGWFWVLVGMIVLHDGVTRPDPGDVRQGLTYIFLGAWFQLMVRAFGPEMAENGLWLVDLIRWKRIRSFRWKDGRDDVLVLRLRSRLGGERDMELRIPEADRASVESILVERGVTRAGNEAA